MNFPACWCAACVPLHGQVRVAERLRFSVTTDLCVQAQPIETL